VIFIGIDPGASGGLAAIDPEGKVIDLTAMPAEEGDILSWCLRMSAGSSGVAYIEMVTGYVGKAESQSSMFEFGKNVGSVHMAMVAAGFIDGESLREVQSGVWQSRVGASRRRKGIDKRDRARAKTEHKASLRDLARSQFPGVHVTLKTCDALLIAQCARIDYSRTDELLERAMKCRA
jgi:hypothetical protein